MITQDRILKDSFTRIRYTSFEMYRILFLFYEKRWWTFLPTTFGISTDHGRRFNTPQGNLP